MTRELGQGHGWRISVAHVESDGDFSKFPNWTRHSIVIAGAGLELRSGSTRLDLRPGAVATYDGGLPWRSTLRDGAVQVLNVMVQPDFAQALVEVASVHPGEEPCSLDAGQFLLCNWAPALVFRCTGDAATQVILVHITSSTIRNRDADLKFARWSTRFAQPRT